MKEVLLESAADLTALMRRHPWYTTMFAVAMLGVISFAGLEWRSERRWQRYVAEAEARGVKLWMADFTRPEIPDAENFAALPIFRVGSRGESRLDALALPAAYRRPTGPRENVYSTPTRRDLPGFGSTVKGTKIDWADWQQYFKDAKFLEATSDQPATDVLRALEHYAPQFQQWSEWRTTRTKCRFTLRHLEQGWDLDVAPLYLCREAEMIFVLRLRAHLALLDSTAAYADFQDGLQAYQATREEPTLSIGLLRVALLHMLVAALGDGLQAHAWADADLRRIQEDLASVRVWDDWRLATETSRADWNTTMEIFANLSFREREAKLEYLNARERRLLAAMPRFIFRDNQVRMNHFYDEMLARIETAHHTIDRTRQTPSAFEQITVPSAQIYYLFMT